MHAGFAINCCVYALRHDRMGLLDLQDWEQAEDDDKNATLTSRRAPPSRRAAARAEAPAPAPAPAEEKEAPEARHATRGARVAQKQRNDRPPPPTTKAEQDALHARAPRTGRRAEGDAYAPDTPVLARCGSAFGQWFPGTVIKAEELTNEVCRVVFLDGEKEDIPVTRVRMWDRPPESDWHRKHRGPIKSKYVSDANKAAAHRAVLQIDLETGLEVGRFISAKRAVEALPTVSDPQEIISCCRRQAPQAGGYGWQFAAPRPKLDAADVQELIDGNYAILCQQRNPKKAGTKSALLYDQYKGAECVRDLLSLGARRADIPYDISHGWITLVDPEMQKRFSPKQGAGGASILSPMLGAGGEAEADDENMAEVDAGGIDGAKEDVLAAVRIDDDGEKEDVIAAVPPPPRASRVKSVNYAED